jgi:2-oxoisovalerate dehydrogenase E2 component (dihydrolipoyl transacylase)
MGEHTIKLPDVGEGVAEAELVEWHVKIGDIVREDAVLGAVMTDKATVEIPSPRDGQVIWLGAEIGDTVAVGSPLIRLKVEGGEESDPPPPAGEGDREAVEGARLAPPPSPAAPGLPPQAREDETAPSSPASGGGGPRSGGGGTPPAPPARLQPARSTGAPRAEGDRPLASPAVRLRAKEAGVDLRQVPGTGPAGRIGHEDLDAFIARGPQAAKITGLTADTSVQDIKLVGLRRKIAEKMAKAKQRIPHITYVEEIDVTALEDLRAQLNKTKRADQPRLTIMPFLMRAMVKAIKDQPNLNSVFDDDAGIIHQYGGVHIGMAAQTRSGLVVATVRHAEARDIWECGAEVNRLADAAKAGTATREELSGSTITITSLGAIGGVVTTPVINYPEVAIIGVNKIMMRPVWDGATFVPRKMMNLSSSFDHRVIDGFDAATFIQRIKGLLESPAMIFVEG